MITLKTGWFIRYKHSEAEVAWHVGPFLDQRKAESFSSENTLGGTFKGEGVENEGIHYYEYTTLEGKDHLLEQVTYSLEECQRISNSLEETNSLAHKNPRRN